MAEGVIVAGGRVVPGRLALRLKFRPRNGCELQLVAWATLFIPLLLFNCAKLISCFFSTVLIITLMKSSLWTNMPGVRTTTSSPCVKVTCVSKLILSTKFG